MKFLSKIANFTFSKKVDTAICRILESTKIRIIPVIVVFTTPIDNILLSRAKRLGLNITYVLPFMNALAGNLPVRNLEKLVGILEVKTIYHDGIAFLCGSEPNPSVKDIGKINYSKSYLNGKDVTIAFIDSGVYPHPDLVKSRNRILSFKDFINKKDFPYDDNGHGTACAGIAVGASLDGKFMSPAYESSLVCAKAFNKHGNGFFSHILAAMQWIIELRDKNNIRILVLPFGTNAFDKNFDVLSMACQKVLDQNIFIITCTGNFGAHECSITSPGVSPHVFTVAAMELADGIATPLSVSGRGPTMNNIEKPDCIMPGKNIAALNCDTTYSPQGRSAYMSNTLPVLYTSISGTSAATSLAAGDVAMLYQKLNTLTPDTAKNILKKCCISVNLLKPVQGAGIICVKYIEDIPSPEHK